MNILVQGPTRNLERDTDTRFVSHLKLLKNGK